MSKGGSYTDGKSMLAVYSLFPDHCADQSCGNFTGFRTLLRPPKSN